jgi:hypothetical protein
MMSISLLNFAIVIAAQFIFLLIHAIAVGETEKLPKYILRGMLIGLPFGILFDLIAGKWLGVFDYELGFTWWFLIINGAFSYGLACANVLLLYHHNVAHVYLWAVALGAFYEIVNFMFAVWNWTFYANPVWEYLIVILLLYPIFVLGLVVILGIVYRGHYRVLNS